MAGIIIAGTNSGVGKTTISMGLMAAFRKKGYEVYPYKVGPDYIDTGFHSFISKNPSYNLDAYLLGEEKVRYEYSKRKSDKNSIKIIEGVMGLYDGFGVVDTIASTAHVSKILNVPVVLVIDGGAVATSAAAEVLGYKMFDLDVDIAGVIVNRVSGEAHYEMIKKAIEHYTNIRCFGYLFKNNDVSLNSRHLGLIPADEVETLSKKIDELANIISETIDLEKIADVADSIKDEEAKMPVDLSNFIDKYKPCFSGKRIAIAKSKAFSFYYQSNIDILKKLGIELVDVNPNTDSELPKDIHAIYLGGGFPEVFAKELSENVRFRSVLKERLDSGLIGYAECGGLMYLTESITTIDGEKYPMSGFIKGHTVMQKRLQRFGYVNVKCDELEFPAHEFHHSKLIDIGEEKRAYKVEKIRDGKLLKEWTCGINKKNTLATYDHVLFLSNLELIRKVFVK
ncbi:MAG: cobyrinate a,c-diamide synthase [Bacillota bacterium]|nr:cobyrinate a,c-diamide synthase [Bacillota bacterium]